MEQTNENQNPAPQTETAQDTGQQQPTVEEGSVYAEEQTYMVVKKPSGEVHVLSELAEGQRPILVAPEQQNIPAFYTIGDEPTFLRKLDRAMSNL